MNKHSFILRRRKIIALLIVFFTEFKIVSSQEIIKPEKEDEINQKIENIAEQIDKEDADYTELTEELRYFQQHPLNLNTAKPEELRQLIFLNELQIYNLLEHIRKNGKLISIYELQTINGFDVNVINAILPYVKVSDTFENNYFNTKELLKYGDNQLFIRYQQVLEKQKGFTSASDDSINRNSSYLGSPQKIYCRYRFKYYNNVSWGITGEKDAGEQFFKGTQKNGFDFYSAHLFLKDFGKLKALAIGDYHVRFGQGLTIWSGLSFGKSSDVMNIKKNTQCIKPYTSADENNFMRGIATTVAFGKLEFTTFYSHKRIDANITERDSLTEDVLSVSSLQQTGLHTTRNEIEDKDALGETVYGTHLTYVNRHLNIGTTLFNVKYDAMLNKNTQLYNQYESNNNQNLTTGLDYSYYTHNINFFGELARSKNGAIATLNGMLLSLNSRLGLSVMHRKYAKDYFSSYSNAFSENTGVVNEQALFTGIVFNPNPVLKLSVYCDNFSFPWLKYSINSPSKGSDYFVQVVYNPTKTIEMYCQFRQKNKNTTCSDKNDMISYIDKTTKQNYRYHISYQVSPSFYLKNRVELVTCKTCDDKPRNGYLIYQDITYKPLSTALSFSCRYALFNTDTYDERIYAYENDVLHAYSIPAYYYKGSRAYLVIRYKIIKNIDIWLRFAQTYYSNRTIISSGLNEIQGNTKSEIKAQVRFTL